MASHLDLEEQEQLDALKHFWKRWGDAITWALIAVLGAYAAWTAWQSWSNRQAAQAAALYDTVERAAILGDVALLERAVSDIEDKYASTTYAQQSAMLAARIYSDKGDVPAARKQLQWLIDKGDDEAYQALARLRLAALLMQEQVFDDARKLLAA
jgi:predicted negative regulator of RcsB-dependent stress response